MVAKRTGKAFSQIFLMDAPMKRTRKVLWLFLLEPDQLLLFLGAVPAAELWMFVFSTIVFKPFDYPISCVNRLTAFITLDVMFYFPHRKWAYLSKNESVYPEKDKATDKVRNYCGYERINAGEEPQYSRQNWSWELPSYKIQAIFLKHSLPPMLLPYLLQLHTLLMIL